LKSVTIPPGVTNIGSYAFGMCLSLADITISDRVAVIGYGAFVMCTNLAAIAFPESVTRIESDAFFGCARLSGVTIPNAVSNIGSYAFGSCVGLTGITVSAGNAVYTSADGVLFDKGLATLVEFPAGRAGSYTIPATVTRIGDFAFYGSANLTTLTLPTGVTNVGNGAFGYCTSLAGLYFQGNAPSLGSSVFESVPAVTVYYRLAMSGWGTWGYVSNVLWDPQVVYDASFGIGAGGFGFTFTNAGSPIVVVEGCTNLLAPLWFPLGTNALTGGSSQFSDALWTNHPVRVYHFRAP